MNIEEKIQLIEEGTLEVIDTEELKEVFHRLPPAQVNITLYGINKEQYKALCGNPKAYDNMLDAVEWLRKEGILLHMNATMIPDNVEYWEAFEHEDVVR